MNDRSKPNRGVALLTVLLVFALAAVAAGAMLSRQHIDIVRTSNMLARTQAWHYALGAEELARQTLWLDAQLTPGIDYPGQRWATLREAFPIEQGTVQLFIEDMQGRFNLNTLLTNNLRPVSQFQSILGALSIAADAASVAASLQNHAQTSPLNDTPSPLLYSVTELRSTEALSVEDYTKLLPYVTVLPENSTLLNINTASDTVLKAIMSGDTIYQRVATLRTDRGYITGDQLQSLGNTMGMDVKSNYFSVTAQVQFKGQMLRLTTLLHRHISPEGALVLDVLRRTMSAY